MKNINLRQKQNIADFFRELAVAFMGVGGFTAIFDKTLSSDTVAYRFISSGLATLILLVISYIILKK